jgi:hypothetical protein
MGLDDFIKDTRSPLAKLVGNGPRPHRCFAFAGSGARFGEAQWAVRALSADEREHAAADAVRWLCEGCKWERSDLYTELGDAVRDLECKVRLLFAALVDPAAPTQALAASADELRKLLDADEIGALFEQLVDYQEERSPFAKLRDWQEVETFCVALGKGYAPMTSLLSYDSASLRFIVRELATKWTARTTPHSSGTTSASDSSAPSMDPASTSPETSPTP